MPAKSLQITHSLPAGSQPEDGLDAEFSFQPAVENCRQKLDLGTDYMRHQNGFRLASPWIRAGDLPALFCSWDLAYRCTKAGWLKPVIQGKRRTIYRLADVLACMQRIETGEVPRSRRNPAAD